MSCCFFFTIYDMMLFFFTILDMMSFFFTILDMFVCKLGAENILFPSFIFLTVKKQAIAFVTTIGTK